MNSTITSDEDPRSRRLAEAAAWRVTLTEKDAETSDAFEAWIGQDPRNAETWASLQTIWDHFGDNAIAPELMTARQETLERAARVQARRFQRRRHSRWAAPRVAAAVLGSAVLAGLGAGGTWYAARPAIYQTALGERRTVLLADGSRIALDSGTLLKVRLGTQLRTLDLVQGQARFDVAHDASRPFQVHARDQTVVATGTSFNVDLTPEKVLVTLIEGRVQVLQDRPAPLLALGSTRAAPVVLARLKAGQELSTSDSDRQTTTAPITALRVEPANLDRATAWESGQLIFEDEPLSSVAQRVSRYSVYPITTEGAAGDLKISGVFNSGDTATFVDTVQRAFPVVAQQAADGSIVLRPRG